MYHKDGDCRGELMMSVRCGETAEVAGWREAPEDATPGPGTEEGKVSLRRRR